MTPTLVPHHPRTSSALPADAGRRARDWAEIQERMLVPLYEAVYAHLEVGAGTRVLGLGCGTGLALLRAKARGASVTGVDTDPARMELARERLAPAPEHAGSGDAPGARLVEGGPEEAADPRRPRFNMITAFQPIGCTAGDSDGLVPALEAAVGRPGRGPPGGAGGGGARGPPPPGGGPPPPPPAP
ncbi:methyltransferase domain-containing protein, partial [Streptomyces sp. NPDC096153]|uniref:class I SAM-dependent methyltransferase n=1 Tax=Streptomyces sp. NPDC096153 TaxID=3155548 RepID=UPI00332C12E6